MSCNLNEFSKNVQKLEKKSVSIIIIEKTRKIRLHMLRVKKNIDCRGHSCAKVHKKNYDRWFFFLLINFLVLFEWIAPSLNEKKHPSNNLFHKSIIKQDKWSITERRKENPFSKNCRRTFHEHSILLTRPWRSNVDTNGYVFAMWSNKQMRECWMLNWSKREIMQLNK